MSRTGVTIFSVLFAASLHACDRPPPPPQESDPEPPAPAEAAEPAPPEVSEAAEPPPPAWTTIDGVPTPSGGHLFELHRDLTGDGLPDTLRIESDGQPYDSSYIALTILVHGDEIYRQEWEARYELGMHFLEEDVTEEEIQEILKESLSEKLARVRVSRFNGHWVLQRWEKQLEDCSGDPRDCIAFQLRRDTEEPDRWGNYTGALDTAGTQGIAEDMLENTQYEVTFQYGYETLVRLAWSEMNQKFYTLFACC